ncbi:MAG: GNAT family N-acetyltransferase [Anaerolineales bacterium]|jgi:GNAT superfamily N-acetyltransferase|nr:GNAT family N-acetyltransferase [Anaerolineales bacterium]
MTLTPTVTPPSTCGQARPLNILRDLPRVADLIETCFKETMDSSGRSHLQEMRRHAQDRIFLGWAPHVVDMVSLPLSGFVWEADGKLVGNVSLIPFHRPGRRIYLIANVATHPDYRGRGIGRILTAMAVERAQEKNANSLWLHVRDDNPAAIKIYHNLGFRERMRRTGWYAAASISHRTDSGTIFQIRSRAARDWDLQRNWLERAYPNELDWYQTQSWTSFGPRLWDGFYRLLADLEVSQWAIESQGQLRGVVSCRYQAGKAPHTWLACPARPDDETLPALLRYARGRFSHLNGLHLEYPAGPADASIRAAGFTPQRTLLWMEAPGQQPN